MVLLSDKYAATTTATHEPLCGRAEVLMALNNAPAVIGVPQTLGVLLMSLLIEVRARGMSAAVSRARMYAAICSSTGGMICAPSPRQTLYPVVLMRVVGWRSPDAGSRVESAGRVCEQGRG